MHIFHWILLGLIPVVFLLALMTQSGTFDIQWHNIYYVVSSLYMAAGLSLVILIKAFLYYLTRTYPFSKTLCYIDVVLLGVICAWVLLSTPMVQINLNLVLLIVFWVLIQLFVFINFFVHLLMRTDKSIGYEEG